MAEPKTSLQALNNAIAEEGYSWQAAENEFSALDEAARNQYLGLIISDAELARLASETKMLAAREAQLAATFGAPAAHDWRNVGGANYVTPVKNQGGCGSCVSFGTVAAMEAKARVQLANPAYPIDLSEAFMQFCGGGSCSGWGLTSGLDYAKSTGTVDDSCMPYKPQNMNCAADRCSDWANRLTKVTAYANHATAAARKDAIVSKGPVVAGMAVYNDFFSYSSGVYHKTASSTLAGYHCVCVVGYSDSLGAWIVKNSWGPSWGMGGFVLIGYNQADLLIDSSWPFYALDAVVLPKAWVNNIAITRIYAHAATKTAYVALDGLGWRSIQPTTVDGVSNMHALFVQSFAHGRKVNALVDGDKVYGAYAL